MNLLTIDDITAITKLSRYHVRDVVVKSPGFPPPAARHRAAQTQVAGTCRAEIPGRQRRTKSEHAA